MMRHGDIDHSEPLEGGGYVVRLDRKPVGFIFEQSRQPRPWALLLVGWGRVQEYATLELARAATDVFLSQPTPLAQGEAHAQPRSRSSLTSHG